MSKLPTSERGLDGFVCRSCGRASYAYGLAPYCRRCREELPELEHMKPRVARAQQSQREDE